MSNRQPKKLPCNNCRQQKARCDAESNSGKPCSRCERLKQTCQVSSDFKRQTKRRRFNEPKPSLTAGVSDPPRDRNENSHDRLSTHNQERCPDPPLTSVGTDRAWSSESSFTTRARSLDGLDMPSETIDRIFNNYFSKYHPFLDILDPCQSPNTYFDRSRLLFWTVLGIGAQYSVDDARLAVSLGPKVNDLAIDCLKWRDQYFDSIQALLLLLNWPLYGGCPADISFALAGAAVHMAMMIGLHVPLSTQEFSKAKIMLTDAEIDRRAELWTHCLIAHGRVCCMKGIAAMKTDAVGSDAETANAFNERLTPRLAYHKRLHRIVMRCNLAIQKNGLRKLSPDQERALELLVHLFSEQLYDIRHEAKSEHDHLGQLIAELQCQCFLFYKLHTPIDEQNLVALQTTSTQVIQSARKLDKLGGFLPLAPVYLRFGILLASYTLLRLLKSPLARFLNDEVRECFLSSINMAKRQSKACGDVPDKHATALTQLWNSTRAFKKSDGSYFTTLRIRSRLAMSVALDAVWWWREEFHGESGALDGNNSVARTSNIVTPQQAVPNAMNQQASMQWDANVLGNMGAFDEQIFVDFGIGTPFDNDMFAGWPTLSTNTSGDAGTHMPSYSN